MFLGSQDPFDTAVVILMQVCQENKKALIALEIGLLNEAGNWIRTFEAIRGSVKRVDDEPFSVGKRYDDALTVGGGQ